MRKFEDPKLELEVIEVYDVITTSCTDDEPCDGYEPCDWEG